MYELIRQGGVIANLSPRSIFETFALSNCAQVPSYYLLIFELTNKVQYPLKEKLDSLLNFYRALLLFIWFQNSGTPSSLSTARLRFTDLRRRLLFLSII